ncbi:MAG: cystathionine beta-lyase, partial [bacterium]|nr:cystathionine beta-lyase [bacterium]
ECRNNSVTCISPTKAFSIAGIQTAAVSIPNPFLRHKVWRALNTDEVAEGNTFSYSAAIAAFNHGERWLNELNAYIWKNKDYACSFIDSEMPDLKVMKGEATYLLWIYIENAFRMKSDEAAQFIRANTGLILNAGTSYGTGGGNFVRINLGCPMSTVREGLERLKKAYYIIKGR